MKVTAISLLLILLPVVSAIDFDMDYPDSVNLNDEFSVSLSAETQETYDIKLFVQNNNTNEIISRIYNDGWKNPYYYLKEVFPNNTNFMVKVTNQSDNPVLCARLRKSGATSYSEECSMIKINIEDSEDIPENKTLQEAVEQENTSIIKNKSLSPDFSSASEPKQEPASEITAESSRIDLNSQSETSENSAFLTADGKLRLLIVYSFTAFTIFIIILLIWKKF